MRVFSAPDDMVDITSELAPYILGDTSLEDAIERACDKYHAALLEIKLSGATPRVVTNEHGIFVGASYR